MIWRRTVLWPTSIAMFTAGGFSSKGSMNSSMEYVPLPSEPKITVVIPCKIWSVAAGILSGAAAEMVSRPTNPGAIIMPFTSRTVSPTAGLNAPMSAIFPSRIRTFPITRGLPVPSMIVPFIRTRFSANAGHVSRHAKRNKRMMHMLHSGIMATLQEPRKEDLLYSTMSELGQLLRTHKLSCKELTLSYVDRIKQLDSKLNSFVTIMEEHAIQEAERV